MGEEEEEEEGPTISVTVAIMCAAADVTDISFKFQIMIENMRDEDMKRKYAQCRHEDRNEAGLQCLFRHYLLTSCTTELCKNKVNQIKVTAPGGEGRSVQTKTLS